MKKYENAASLALRTRSKSALVEALALNPLVPAESAAVLAEKYVKINAPYVEYGK